MNDLQMLILTLFLGLFGLLINYLVKFFRSAAKTAEENQAQEAEISNDINSKQVFLSTIFIFPVLAVQNLLEFS